MKTKQLKKKISDLWEPMDFRKLQGKKNTLKFRKAVPRRERATELPVTFIREGVHMTLPPHIFSVKVKSEAYYIMGQWGASSE